MHYLPYVAVGFLFLFNISESLCAPSHKFISTSADEELENESPRVSGDVWKGSLSSGILSHLPERDESFENKFIASSENDNEKESSLNNQVNGSGGRKLESNYEDGRRQSQMNLAKAAILLNSPNVRYDLDTNPWNGRRQGRNDQWDLVVDTSKVHDERGFTARNFHPRFKFGHNRLLPQFPGNVEGSSSYYQLMKRSPECLKKCFRQGLMHPAQCHSLC